MKKERILYFDIIKVIAVILVFVCCFERTLEYYNISYSLKLLPDNIFSVDTGTVGCILYFIISGASLSYVYQRKIEKKQYYIKRFERIYPMFWIAFIFFFSLAFRIDGSYKQNIPLTRVIYTVLGIDAIAECVYPTFYTVGEWFLGVIIFLYIIFPILKKCVEEFPWASFMVPTLIGIIVDYTYSNTQIHISLLFVVWIPLFVFGMIFVNKVKRVSRKAMLFALLVITLYTVFDFTFINFMTESYIMGISLFIVLVYLLYDYDGQFGQIASKCSKYCYPFFLVHRRIMLIFMNCMSGNSINETRLILLFIFLFLISIVISVILDKVTNTVIAIWKLRKQRANLLKAFETILICSILIALVGVSFKKEKTDAILLSDSIEYSDEELNAEIKSHNAPIEAQYGEQYQISIIVENKGTKAWSNSENIRLCIWQDGYDYGFRVNIADDVVVENGQEYTFILDGFMLSDRSSAELEFQMVEEGITYFGEREKVEISAME